MKKSILIAVAAVAVLSVSCKKTYTCSCTGTDLPANFKSFEYPKMKKADAESSCDAQQTTLKNGGYSDASCSI